MTSTTWPGKPVTCAVCLQSGVPYFDADDHCWRMPRHDWDDTNECGSCPGSLSVVAAQPVSDNMEQRIEANMVAAMPPDPNEVPEAKGLEPGESIWG